MGCGSSTSSQGTTVPLTNTTATTSTTNLNGKGNCSSTANSSFATVNKNTNATAANGGGKGSGLNPLVGSGWQGGTSSNSNGGNGKALSTPVGSLGSGLISPLPLGMLVCDMEAALSDISSTGSTSRTNSMSVPRVGNHHSTLEQEREEAVPTIEEELFVYDDVTIARPSTMFRNRQRAMATRRAVWEAPRKASDGLMSERPDGSTFMFNDFSVPLVDELDFSGMRPTQGEGTAGTVEEDDDAADMPTFARLPPITSRGTAAGTGGGSVVPASTVDGLTSAPVTLSNGTTCRSANVCNRTARLRQLEQEAIAMRSRGFDVIRQLRVSTHIGHHCRVKCVALAPGEREFVSCSNEDTLVTLASVRSGREIANFVGHRDTVIAASFSADGKFLATTSRDQTMILWDVVTAKQVLQFEHSKVVICCCFSPDSRFVATGCQDKVCRLWETRRGREAVYFAEHDGIIITMAFSPDGACVASASADKTVRLWSAATGKAVHVLRGHGGIVLSCSFTRDGISIVTNDERAIKVWNAAAGTCTRTIAAEDMASGTLASKRVSWTLCCPAPGGFTRFIAAACSNRFVYLIDIATGREVGSHFCKAPVYSMASGTLSTIAFGDSFGNLYMADLSS